ncbi:hypothetical protein OROHE_015070 [Orobanche hederae]
MSTQLGLSDKLKKNVVKISRKLNFKRLFAPSTNGAVKLQVINDLLDPTGQNLRERRCSEFAKSAFDKALAEHEDIDDAIGSEEPTERDQGVDLQQPLLIKIDSSDSHKK